MKKSIIILILALIVSNLSNAKNEFCQSLSDFLKQPHHLHHGINVSLAQMASLDYLRHALIHNYKPKDNVCTQVLVMSKNEYKYYRYLIHLTVNNHETPAKRFNHYFYFQDASTQAFHNYFSKPWIGIDGYEIEEYLSLLKIYLQQELRSSVKVRENSYILLAYDNFKQNPIEEIKGTKYYQSQKPFINGDTLSVFKIDEHSFLVTWMRRLSNSDNPFLNVEISEGYYLEFNSNLNGFEGLIYRPANTKVINKAGINQNLFEHLESNLFSTKKTLPNLNRSEVLFNLRTEKL